MSEENVEIVRRGYEALQSKNLFAGLDWFFAEFADPEFFLCPPEELPDIGGQIFRGRDEVEGFFRNFSEVAGEFRFELEGLEAGEDNRVVAMVHTIGHGRGSGAPFDFREAHVWTMRDARAVGMEVYFDREEGRKAAGLSE